MSQYTVEQDDIGGGLQQLVASRVESALCRRDQQAENSAAIVAIGAIPSFTTSFVSVLRCSSGNTVRKSRPNSAPPKTHAKAMQAIAIELKIYLPTVTSPQT